ncbi:PTS sugar transporter subunit IIA [Klugiella xanthotipulae]|uniref:BglG family transcriptional antiterminator n=1 Tax=Klugiella xanthotipulae TaxID=244735 RepID=A0A543I579_9MICO|nr:PTS sugar transporter subunit IIA [Klugiella xanthotipulae]TQM65752.1 BglG family transcriptional antiterminator [Klugiella xanthotipulae]
MSTERAKSLVAYLAQADDWVTASELAHTLGVTTRSVRNYATEMRDHYAPFEVLIRGPLGYRINRVALQAHHEATSGNLSPESTAISRAGIDRGSERPAHRQRAIVEWILGNTSPVDPHEIAAHFFISESTLEADLRRQRPVVARAGLTPTRRANGISIEGHEPNKRRLLATLYLEDLDNNVIDLTDVARTYGVPPLGPIKTAVIDRLESYGYRVNEFGLSSVLLSLAIIASRIRTGHFLAPGDAEPLDEDDQLIPLAAALLEQVATPPARAEEARHLARLMHTQVARGGSVSPEDDAEEHADPPARAATRRRSAESLSVLRTQVAAAVELASHHYAIALTDDELVTRLTDHVANMLDRMRDQLSSPNPMTRSLKTHYPVVYDVAVFLATELSRVNGVRVDENEIAFLALHIGSFLAQRPSRTQRVRCAFVCPDYYSMHRFLRERIEEELADIIEVVTVVTRTDVAWAHLEVDLILSTIPAPTSVHNVLQIQPFLTEEDAERIRARVSRFHRTKRRAALKERLLRYLSPELFTAHLDVSDESEAITHLGGLMVEQGIIDDSYVQGALDRERMSSTAFNDLIAIPHALTMTARRTAIAIAVTKTALPWGSSRVHVIAFIAFAESERNEFQSVFDQLVKVFSSREDVQHILRSSATFDGFIDALARVMDA